MDKEENVNNAVNLIRRTVKNDKPRVVALPECFNSPYSTKHFKDYAETIPHGPTCQRLSQIAKELNVYVIGGTIPERESTCNYYNTCTIWSPTGAFLGKYRKVIHNSICSQFFNSKKSLFPLPFRCADSSIRYGFDRKDSI